MDGDGFDRLTRAMASSAARPTSERRLSRQAFLRLAGAIGVIGIGGVEATTVSADSKPHGASKKKHHHHHHHHGGGGGGCTADAAGGDGFAVTQTTQLAFQGQPLQAVHTVQPFGPHGETGGRLDLTLAGAPLLTIETASEGRTLTVSLDYGAAFSGISRARFTSDGATVTGEIDGRAIVPLPADGDPNQIQFADGAPPPDVQIDKDLAKAVQALLRQAQDDAKNCHPAPPSSAATRAAKAGRRHAAPARHGGVRPSDHPEQSPDCLAIYAEICEPLSIGCMAGVDGLCSLAFLGYGVCIALGLYACFVASLKCRKEVRVGDTCCPVKCGGSADPNDIFSDDPGCCEAGEICLDPSSNRSGCCANGTRPCAGQSCCKPDEQCSPDGLCCGPGFSSCQGVCCANGSCLAGGCCDSPNHVCGSTCCPPFSSCCNGTCCNGECVNNVCCQPPNQRCGITCCANLCCNDVCCNDGESCDPQSGACARICNPQIGETITCPPEPGFPTCCTDLFPVCCANGQCCRPTEFCCTDGVCRTNCIH